MKTISMLGLGLVALLVGCGDNQNRSSIQAVGDAAAINSGSQQFDQAKEPALTSDTHFAAGQLAESQGQPARAIEQYTEALKVDPKHQPSMYRIAVIQTQAKQYDQAIASWKQYVQA